MLPKTYRNALLLEVVLLMFVLAFGVLYVWSAVTESLSVWWQALLGITTVALTLYFVVANTQRRELS